MMSNDKRGQNLEKALEVLQESHYIYDLSKGGVNAKEHAPPPYGTRMNCQSAARVFVQIAIDMGMEPGSLQPMLYKNDRFGYFVPARTGLLALGCQPEIDTTAVKGWEFEKHWRVRDTKLGVVYDPTFGTAGNDNPQGILGTSEIVNGLNMTTVYGEKYRIARINGRVECEEISKTPPGQKYLVSDFHFKPDTLGNLRIRA
jgi:hypothetical protein